MKQHPWIELVEKYSASERRFGSIPPPATEADIRSLLHDATREELTVPEDYVEFLRVRNGTSFNGLMLYGANIQKGDEFRRQDLAAMNQYQLNRTDETVLGTSDQDAYVVIGQNGPYRRLERVSWDVLDEFNTCDDLLTSIFAYQVEMLSDVQ